MVNRHHKEFLKSQVIEDSLKGKTREEIAIQNNTSTGNVSHIQRDFKKKIGESAFDETIEFARMVRKSGITMDQCLEGYRMYQLMEKLGFNADNESNDKNKEFQDFVNKIYFPCKDIGIHAPWIFEWIEDLLSITVKLKSIQQLSSINKESRFTKQDVNSFEDSLDMYHEQYIKRTNLEDDNQLPLINYNFAVEADLPGSEEAEHHFPYTYCKPRNSTSSNFHGLLLSDIVNLISQVAENRCEVICSYHQKIKNETIKMENKFTKVKNSLQKTKIRNQNFLHFEDWFYRAKQQLWEIDGIRIETDLPKFIKAMSEFSRHNHDSYEILNEYRKHQSIDHEIAERSILSKDKSGK